MNVLVAYATHHGSTREIAERVGVTVGARRLGITVMPVDQVRDVGRFDAFVVGSALYCGWLKEATDFVRRNKRALVGRPVWLFSSGPLGTATTDENGNDVRAAAAPKEVAQLGASINARDHHVFFGAYDPTARPVGFLERTMRLAPGGAHILKAGDFRDWAEIDAWATTIADELAASGTTATVATH